MSKRSRAVFSRGCGIVVAVFVLQLVRVGTTVAADQDAAPHAAATTTATGLTPDKREDSLAVAGVVTGGFGVVAAVAGIVLNLKANSMVGDMESGLDAYTSSTESRQKTYKTLAWASYGVGAACMAAGAVLIAVGMSRSDSALALVPAVGPGQAGLVLGGGF